MCMTPKGGEQGSSNMQITPSTPSVQQMVNNQKKPLYIQAQTPLEQSLKPTPAESNIINYHRNTIKNGTVGTDEQGRPVTVYSTGIIIPEGANKGKFVAVPAFIGGKIIRNENKLYEIWKDDIQAGKYPVYNSGKELNTRSQELHQIMDDEESAAIMSRSKH